MAPITETAPSPWMCTAQEGIGCEPFYLSHIKIYLNEAPALGANKNLQNWFGVFSKKCSKSLRTEKGVVKQVVDLGQKNLEVCV